jgi:hypothetical protein
MKNSELQEDYDIFMNFDVVLNWTKFPAEKFPWNIQSIISCILYFNHILALTNWSTMYCTHYVPTVHNERLGMLCIQMLVSVLCTSVTAMHSVQWHIATGSVATHHSTWHAHTDPQECSDWAITYVSLVPKDMTIQVFQFC